MMIETMTTETLEFKAELKQLLHLITHSLYSDREIFLRELISNASDAINKVKFNSGADEEALEGNKDWKITIIPDEEAKTLTLRDNGIGMSRDEVIENLGTIAKSGTKAFMEAVKAKQANDLPGLIGQFGVGFYSAFMVADTVSVHTRSRGGPDLGVRWTSAGQGDYTLEAAPKAERGTEIVLHLKEDAVEYLSEWKLRSIVKKFSDFIEHPVELVTTETEEDKTETKTETINNQKAIWLRSPRDVKEEEYTEFYKTISRDFEAPAKVMHFRIEGKSEFQALLFIPSKKPFSFDYEEQKAGLKLYVQRVLIMDECEEVLPSYLRFVKGVIDSADLPLNVSRELLQQNPHLETIKKNVVRNILSGLEGMKNVDYDKYLVFYQGLGNVLKEGLARDWDNKEKIADLLLFEHANGLAGQYTTLADYAEKMPAEQKEIYYLSGESAEQLRNSPYLEAFRAKGYDVLLMTDAIDEFTLPHLRDYKEKKLQRADQADVKPTDSEIAPETQVQFASLLTAMKGQLPDVTDIRLTRRLTESAACLVVEGGMSAHMERILKRAGEAADGNKRILELNPEHAAVVALKSLHAKSPDDARLAASMKLLYEQSLIAEGSRIMDPTGFAQRINSLIIEATK
jgi:molecular chaperone HtpG